MQVAEMKRNVTPETPDFPLLVKKGSATVKIYEVKNRDRKNDTVSYLRAVNGRCAEPSMRHYFGRCGSERGACIGTSNRFLALTEKSPRWHHENPDTPVSLGRGYLPIDFLEESGVKSLP
jgi:hypothetical protein